VRSSPRTPDTNQRSRSGDDNDHNEGSPQNQQEEMTQLESSSALPFRGAQVAHSREFELRRHTTLEQMQERWNTRRDEPE
jgi:hypothetical protein